MLIIYALLVIMVLIWSFSFVLVDIVIYFVSPMSLALTRFLIVSLVFILMDLYFLLNRKIRNTKIEEKKKRIFTLKENGYISLLQVFVELPFSSLFNILQ